MVFREEIDMSHAQLPGGEPYTNAGLSRLDICPPESLIARRRSVDFGREVIESSHPVHPDGPYRPVVPHHDGGK